MAEIKNLRTLAEIKNKLKEVIGDETILQLARDGMCPHYILTNPLTKEETVLFNAGQLGEWLQQFVRFNDGNFTPVLKFNYFNRQLNAASGNDIPIELMPLGENLFELNMDHINTPPGIYFLVKAGKIVYVGQSINIAARITIHFKEGKDFDRVYFIVCPAERLDEFEIDFIRHFQPPLNKTGLRKVQS